MFSRDTDRAAPQASGKPREKVFRYDVQGLRAAALICVVLYHFGVGSFEGGYAAVDVFFVISGYVIGQNFRYELETGTFSIGHFFARRVARILPALFTTIAGTMVIGYFLLSPQDLTTLGRESSRALMMISNIYFRSLNTDHGYFGDDSQEHPLLHTWSLSVEEQFYIGLPLLILFCLRFFGKFGMPAIVTVLVVSFVMNIELTGRSQQSAFYLSHARAWEFMLGVFGAWLTFKPTRLVAHLGSALGFALMLCAGAFFTTQTKFPGYAALLPSVGAFLVIMCRTESKGTLVARVLALPPLLFLGEISYSAYLWHWPILYFLRKLTPHALTPAIIVAGLVTIVIVGALSYQYIERPVRRLGAKRIRPAMAGTLSFGAVAIACAFALVVTQGAPGRFSPQTLKVLEANATRTGDFSTDCLNFKVDPRQTPAETCPVRGATNKNIVFWGDSHMAAYQPVVTDLVKADRTNGLGAVFTISASCAPSTTLNPVGSGYRCNEFGRYAMARALQDDVSAVVLAFSGGGDGSAGSYMCKMDGDKCTAKLGADAARDLAIWELSIMVDKLQAQHKKVMIALPTPIFDSRMPQLAVTNAILSRVGMSIAAKEDPDSKLRRRLLATFKDKGVTFYDPRAALCPNGQCLGMIDGVSIYTDREHVSVTAARELLTEGFATSLSAMLGVPPKTSQISMTPDL